MSATACAPVVLVHPMTPCPEWCDGCMQYNDENWSDYKEYAIRGHGGRVAEFNAEPVAYASGPASLDLDVSVTAWEQYRLTLAGDLAHETSPVRVEMHAVVSYGNSPDEVSWGMTPEQADHLAHALQTAAHQAREISKVRS